MRNIPQKGAQRVEKPLGIIKFALQAMITEEITFWASATRRTPKKSSKTRSAGSKTPTYTQIWMQAMTCEEITFWTSTSHRTMIIQSSETRSADPKTPQVHSNLDAGYDLRENRLLGMKVWSYLRRNIPQKHSQRVPKPSRYTQISATRYDLRGNRLLGIGV